MQTYYQKSTIYSMFKEFYILLQARELSQFLGIPLNCVIPVKNYCEELEPDQDADILLLSALMQMLNYADSFYENQPIYTEGEASLQQEGYKSCEMMRPDL